MFKNQDFIFARIFSLRFAMMLTLCLCASFGYSQADETPSNAILQGIVGIESQRLSEGEIRIQPGTSVKLKLNVENKGQSASAPGQAYIRFVFSKPLENAPNSLIFETEKVEMPTIEPGKKWEVTFEKTHQWPTLLDFIRDDWTMREYQAMVGIDKQEKTIGTQAITVSAYYYPGVRKELPTQVPSMSFSISESSK